MSQLKEPVVKNEMRSPWSNSSSPLQVFATAVNVCNRRCVPGKSTVFLQGLLCEVASGGGREGGKSEAHSISAILNIYAHVLPKMQRDTTDKMDDFFRESK